MISKAECEKIGRCSCQDCAFKTSGELCAKERIELFMSQCWRNL